jgi:hypothetical protein
MQNTLSGEGLDASYQALRNVVTHPEFQRVLTEIPGSLSPIERLQAVFTRLAPQALAARGIPIPEGFDVTTHVSGHSAGSTTNTADVVTTGQIAGDRLGGQGGPEVCVVIGPVQFCWHP